MAERSIATDCKSVAPVATKVRILPCPPTFALKQAKVAHRSGFAAEVGRKDKFELRLASQVEFVKSMKAQGRKKRRASGVARREGGSNSVVESQPSKLLVAGSIPVSRSIRLALRLPDGKRKTRSWQATWVVECPERDIDLRSKSMSSRRAE